MAEQEEKTLLIRITQYVDKSNPENPPVSLSVDCYFGYFKTEGDYEKISTDEEISYPTLDGLCSKLSEYIKSNEIFSLNPDSHMCVFHAPVIFLGIIWDKNDSPQPLPIDDKKLGSGYSFIIGGKNHNDEEQPIPFFEKKATFDGKFLTPMCFTKARFEDYVENKADWERGIEFQDCYFVKDVNFENYNPNGTMTKGVTIFGQCTFDKNAIFSSSSFDTRTNFYYSTFKQEAIFIHSKFSDVASFYFATFHKPPSFSMCAFNNPRLANFIGVDTSRFDMESIKEYIKEGVKNEKNENGEYNDLMGRGIEYLKTQHALNTRDSFRTIKETLNAQANVLESQKWHKLELYAKELELECRIKGLEKLRQEAQYFSEIEAQDEIQLQIEAETNQLSPARIRQNDSKEMLKINERERLKNIIEYCQLWFYRHTSDHHTDLFKIIGWILIAIGAFGISLFAYRYGLDFKGFIDQHKNDDFIQFFSEIADFVTQLLDLTQAKLLLLFYAWFLACLIIGGWIRVAVSSLIVFCVVLIQPKYILGVVGLMSNPVKMNGAFENLVFVIYSIVMALLLFSLQKTARKNSIIPN